MTLKQKVLKTLYPAWIAITKMAGKNTRIIYNEKGNRPPESIYDLQFETGAGTRINLSQFKGQKMLFVNTASDCGYTAQYAELQQLHQHSGDKVVVLGFPANDFGEQEQGTNEEIQAFCSVNFGTSFPLAKKSVVIKNTGQHSVYQWLTSKGRNGWNNKQPSWNFSKYLVNEEGTLTHYFDPSVSPVKVEVLRAINS